MSRELGSLQKEILDTLDEAKRDRTGYRGFSGEKISLTFPPGHRWTLPGWVTVGRNTVRLGLYVYDLRTSCAFLARRHAKIEYGGIKPSFAARRPGHETAEGREMTGEQCRVARERLNWTRHELATATGVPLWFIAAFEDGRPTPDFLACNEVELCVTLEVRNPRDPERRFQTIVSTQSTRS